MIDHITLFYTLAQIAGVFVGFGTLIAVTKPKDVTIAQSQALTGAVMTGLLVIVAALLPVLLFTYSDAPDIVWPVSAGLVFVINWATLWAQRTPFIDAIKRRNPWEILLLFGIEAMVEVPLILILLPVFPAHSFQLYATMLVFSIVQAASMLMLLALDLTVDDD